MGELVEDKEKPYSWDRLCLRIKNSAASHTFKISDLVTEFLTVRYRDELGWIQLWLSKRRTYTFEYIVGAPKSLQENLKLLIYNARLKPSGSRVSDGRKDQSCACFAAASLAPARTGCFPNMHIPFAGQPKPLQSKPLIESILRIGGLYIATPTQDGSESTQRHANTNTHEFKTLPITAIPCRCSVLDPFFGLPFESIAADWSECHNVAMLSIWRAAMTRVFHAFNTELPDDFEILRYSEPLSAGKYHATPGLLAMAPITSAASLYLSFAPVLNTCIRSGGRSCDQQREERDAVVLGASRGQGASGGCWLQHLRLWPSRHVPLRALLLRGTGVVFGEWT